MENGELQSEMCLVFQCNPVRGACQFIPPGYGLPAAIPAARHRDRTVKATVETQNLASLLCWSIFLPGLIEARCFVLVLLHRFEREEIIDEYLEPWLRHVFP